MSSITEAGVTVAALIVGVAALSVIVSTKSNSTNVIQAVASGFNNAVATAISPVTGASATPILAYPGSTSPNLGLGSPNIL